MARFVHENASHRTKRAKPSGIHRRDGTGHLDPEHENRLLLLARNGRNADGDSSSIHAFVAGRRTHEELGEELAESYLQSATSGEPSEIERLDRVTVAENGGPYILTATDVGVPVKSGAPRRRSVRPHLP
jgi:hypothetical protein